MVTVEVRVGRCCVGMYSNICVVRGKILVGEWCYEDVGSCEVQQVARCSFQLACNVMKTCMCVYVIDKSLCLIAAHVLKVNRMCKSQM